PVLGNLIQRQRTRENCEKWNKQAKPLAIECAQEGKFRTKPDGDAPVRDTHEVTKNNRTGNRDQLAVAQAREHQANQEQRDRHPIVKKRTDKFPAKSKQAPYS